MNLIDGFVRDEIFVDFGSEIMYGSDQQNVNYPSRFPTVEFQLIATFGLSQIADRIRKDAGFKPMHPIILLLVCPSVIENIDQTGNVLSIFNRCGYHSG